MGDKTAIEWTEATWNPIVGCSKVGSPGCANCYAIGVAHRGMAPQHKGLTVRTPNGVDWTGEVRVARSVFDKPLRWARPRRIFVNSLSDLFHNSVPLEVIAEVFAIMALAPQHTFQVLTKRPQRMAQVLSDPEFFTRHVLAAAGRLGQPAERGGLGQPTARLMGRDGPELLHADRWPLPNVWLGTSIETDRYSFRADHVRATPAAVRWISAEPLLGPLPSLDLTGVDWLVAGGESGRGARRMDPDWARDLLGACRAAGTAYLFKQTGSVLAREWGLTHSKGGELSELPADLAVRDYPAAVNDSSAAVEVALAVNAVP